MKHIKKIFALVLVLLLAMSFLTGCLDEAAEKEYREKVERDKGSKALAENLKNTANVIAKNQSTLENKIPIPEMQWSNNRANIVKKLDSFGSDPNKVSWIYCFLPGGQLVLFTSVKGCVTNLSAYAVPDDQIIDHVTTVSVPNSSQVVQAPDADGTYGSNGDGIYWFDTAGVYHEWNGFYMLMDQPQKLNIQPLITMNVDQR